ncbi:transmembrane protein 229B [Hydra vulgaris]|uniref:Transmembrane protein 229B n=1 Tax=Hydra vulgaris TaxID=6087 RepID=A0ABM4CLX7_HYDVU|nr:transmembrane protein 229B-like [Hydra vulgaris]
MTNHEGLPLFSKLIFYGMCGFFVEVLFTAVWYLLDPKYAYGWTLHGCTSLWSFPIYSISTFVTENLYIFLKPKIPLPLRIFVYILWTYLWEYSTGSILRLFNACPWNYESYTTYHVHGLITFDYAPLWALALVLGELVTIKTALRLQYVSKSDKIE